jgi:alpha-beta hydrolase superfamily lysophospholipase
MKSSSKRTRVKNMIGLLLAPVLFLVLLRWFEHRTVFQPSSRLDATGDELGFAREDVWLTTSDGVELHGWYFPSEVRSQRRVFLVCHGNGGNISHRLPLYDVLRREGTAVLAFDYRGYGRSGGRPSEAGTYRDVRAAYEWLTGRGFRGRDIIAFGESLGGGVASELALTHELGGLVLMSTYTSTKDIGAELFPWLPVQTLGGINYPTRERLRRIHVPVLVMHSDEDTIIPSHHGRRNFEAANEPKLYQTLRGDHNDTFVMDRSAVSTGVNRLLELIAAERKEVADDSATEPNAPDVQDPETGR